MSVSAPPSHAKPTCNGTRSYRFAAVLVTVLLCGHVLDNAPVVNAAPPNAEPQCNNYNALPGSLPSSQAADVIAAAGINDTVARVVQTAIEFERSNFAQGSIRDDPFYTLPANASSAKPGVLLSTEQTTDVSGYTVPPNLAISRFTYQSATFNGTAVPATAFVLWPWTPQPYPNLDGKIPVVAWAHGTTGLNAECAPSHYQNLGYGYSALFTLALMGYAVIGVDYAGLGINQTADGEPITHQWTASPAGAKDLLYAVEAARTAWSGELSKEFVVMGHSQGGGIAWAAAERQVQHPVEGYLGTVSASPVTTYSHYATQPVNKAGRWAAMSARTVASIFPDAFNVSDWLTPEGQQALTLYNDLSGCQSIRQALLADSEVTYVKPTWSESWVLNAFDRLVGVGGRPFAGPMLVLHGTTDGLVDFNVTKAAVNATCGEIPDADLQFLAFEGVGHGPSLFAGQRIWLNWIADRFSGRETPGTCTDERIRPARGIKTYQGGFNYFLEKPLYAYETA
ncbi:MAG: hypothetical protein M1831_002985 [Alyxoria varia]|nr:MAG: hypothetical protein M1831_002985 [Alyxoria varia]